MSTATLLPARHVIFDVELDGLAHTRLDCDAHVGLIEVVEAHLGAPCDDPGLVLDVADRLGLIAPAALADHARPCARCTLVAAPSWRAAA